MCHYCLPEGEAKPYKAEENIWASQIQERYKSWIQNLEYPQKISSRNLCLDVNSTKIKAFALLKIDHRKQKYFQTIYLIKDLYPEYIKKSQYHDSENQIK